MQANSAEQHMTEPSSVILGVVPGLIDSDALLEEETIHEQEPFCFHGQFASCMEMFTDAATVAQYLNAHRDWFHRCAHPMQADAIGENGYAITIGKFGSFGYEVEPKIGLDLLPQEQGVYRIQTIPVPGYEPPGYDVDFRAALQLIEMEPDPSLFSRQAIANLPPQLTQVEWELDLKVTVHFPRFIQALPKSLIQSTGDRLLNQIVRQVSRCLTHKVQEDFHNSLNLAFPKKRRKGLWSRHPESTVEQP